MNFAGKMNNDDFFNGIIHLMQTDTAVDAPADAIAWSKNIFRTRAVQPKQSLVQRIFAVLKMDLSPDQAAFGERSAATGATRQMLFTAGETGIDLRIAKNANGGVRVNGQILGEGFAAATVTLSNDAMSYSSTTGELGEFTLENVVAGNYSLTLKTVGKEIAIESIELG